MMNALGIVLIEAINLLILPLLLVGVVRKVKAWMQMRRGAPVFQPVFDLLKSLRKSQTVSETASWVFIWAPPIALAVAVVVAATVPWAGAIEPRGWSPASNIILVLYLLALSRFLSMLAALDTGSAFGGLGASREAAVSILVEPTMVIALASVAVQSGSTELLTMLSAAGSPSVFVFAGVAFLIASLAELSRMPVDDPTTHLELTMIHEALILENSGVGLALTEYAGALRLCIYLGISAQLMLHPLLSAFASQAGLRYGLGVAALFVFGVFVAVLEGLTVRLKWRSIPNLLAYAAIAGCLAAFFAVGGPRSFQ